MMQLTLVGFGNQARSWGLNLKDSKFPVRIALHEGSRSISQATELGLDVVKIGTPEFYKSAALALLIPDHAQADFLKDHASKLKAGTRVLYAHGYSLLESKLEKLFPELQHILLAPKSIGSELRNQFVLKGKLGGVYSLEHVTSDRASTEAWVLQVSKALGLNLGPYKTSFKRETEADLYSEQGLLCSLIPYTAGEMFKHLVEKGTEPELAYFECWLELKLIINAMVDKGPEGFFDLISPNALIGAEKGFERLMTEEFKANLQSLLIEIQNGSFNQEIKQTDIPALRTKIRERWATTPLMKTFHTINREPPHEKAQSPGHP